MKLWPAKDTSAVASILVPAAIASMNEQKVKSGKRVAQMRARSGGVSHLLILGVAGRAGAGPGQHLRITDNPTSVDTSGCLGRT